MMRKLIYYIIMILILIVYSEISMAESHLTLSAQELTIGDKLLIETSDSASKRSFALFLNGEQINTGAVTSAKHAAMNPQVAGQYALVLTPEGERSETVCFSVYDRLSAALVLSSTSVKAGEKITLHTHTEGGSPEKIYDYSVWKGTERIARESSSQSTFEYTPFFEGKLILSVSVTDSLGNSASAVSEPVIVEGSASIAVAGDLSPVLVQGDIRTMTISSPGPWKAQTESEYITLMNTCGDSGDDLIYAVNASVSGARSGIITITSLGMNRKIVIRQSEENAEEAEVHLFEDIYDWIEADGCSALSWLCPAEGMIRTSQIVASGSWDAVADADFLHFRQEDNQLIVTVDENTSPECRAASIYLHSGEAFAVIGVAQPGRSKGAAIREVLLSSDRGTAYQDEITVRVLTDDTAKSVSVRIDRQSPLVFDLGFAQPVTDGLQWRFSVPLTGAGAQSWLFYADNPEGSDTKALATVNVTAEEPAFFSDAEISDDGSQVCVLVTQNTEQITALDKNGSILKSYAVMDARVDRAVDVAGRYAQWTLPLSGIMPDVLSVGKNTVRINRTEHVMEEVSEESDMTSFTLYSQMDGTWRNKKYRKSNLEKSGCAIFALSHALQLLGHHEEASRPEQLAVTYAFCLVDGGTLNSTLIGNAGKEFGYKTRFKLYTDKKEITRKLAQGALFSFGIVTGHIALIDRLSDDGTMCHIIDSAPTATFERITGEMPSIYDEISGKFIQVSTPAEIPGLLYYVDTEGYDGAEYWLSLRYVSERGVRLIQP